MRNMKQSRILPALVLACLLLLVSPTAAMAQTADDRKETALIALGVAIAVGMIFFAGHSTFSSGDDASASFADHDWKESPYDLEPVFKVSEDERYTGLRLVRRF